jgi:hypothetical protein
MEVHEYAVLFPMASDDEIREMADDIKKRGLLNPIITLDGKILDGRNRAKACEMAGITPRCQPYQGADPLGDVVSWNLKRRHLSVSQKSTLAIRLKPMFEVKAKERQLATQNNESGKAVRANLPELVKGKSVDQAAAAVGVSGRTVQDAEYVKKHAPEVFEKIGTKGADGKEFTVNAAKKEVKERVDYQAPVRAKPRNETKGGDKKGVELPAALRRAVSTLRTEVMLMNSKGWKEGHADKLLSDVEAILDTIES